MVKVIQNNRKVILSFTDLFEKYSQDVFRYSLSILGDEDEAKDPFLAKDHDLEQLRGAKVLPHRQVAIPIPID